MDPEQTFLRVHARLSGMLSQLLTPRIRMTLEYIYLVVALALFALLVVMHTNFVQQPGCSSELSGVEIAEAQLVQIKITSVGLWSQYLADRKVIYSQNQGISTESLKISDGNGDGFTFSAAKFWAAWISSGARRSKLNFKFWKGDKEFLESQVESAVDGSIKKPIGDETEIREDIEAPRMGLPISARESFKSSVNYFLRKRYMQFSSFQKNMQQFPLGAGRLLSTAGWDVLTDFPNCLQMLHLEHLKSLIVQWLEKRSKAFEPTYLYTLEKGYFLLPEGAKFQHNIRTVNVSISAHHSCFGNRWQQLLINSFVGYDTILMNSLLSFPGAGYLYNFQTKEFYDLSYGPKTSNGRARFGDYLVTKCSVLIMSLFVFFTTTMSVSFTLRETQSRMLKFTVQLQHHARHQLPTFQLIFVHVIESLVFVPIMIGILFFLFEFYDDQLLAFLVLTLVWLCELFTMISVRTPISMQFFPRFFLLYFLMFHIYFFSYAYGFSYLAFSTTAAFMQHLILYFWNRHEVPALQRFMSRTHFQQQAGVQVTSSTILTSTLHIARVSMRSPAIIVNDDEMVTGPGGGPAGSRTTDSVVEAAGDSITTETEQSATGRDHSDSSIIGSGHHHQLPSESEGIQQETETAAPNHHPSSSSSLNPFSSLLLWILGGTSSDSLVSFFSMFRDLRDDQDQVYAPPPPPPPHGNEPST